jgi:hypothetical protein
VAYGAALERRFGSNLIEGSNPSLSAICTVRSDLSGNLRTFVSGRSTGVSALFEIFHSVGRLPGWISTCSLS